MLRWFWVKKDIFCFLSHPQVSHFLFAWVSGLRAPNGAPLFCQEEDWWLKISPGDISRISPRPALKLSTYGDSEIDTRTVVVTKSSRGTPQRRCDMMLQFASTGRARDHSTVRQMLRGIRLGNQKNYQYPVYKKSKDCVPFTQASFFLSFLGFVLFLITTAHAYPSNTSGTIKDGLQMI